MVPSPEHWQGYASERAPDARIELLGEVSADQYAELLGAADLAVQLQPGLGGEARAVVADCLASGLPTIVTELGWASELPLRGGRQGPTGRGAPPAQGPDGETARRQRRASRGQPGRARTRAPL